MSNEPTLLTVEDQVSPRGQQVDIRCPNTRCNHAMFTRAVGVLNPPRGMPYVELECVCKDRQCRRMFTVRVGAVLQ